MVVSQALRTTPQVPSVPVSPYAGMPGNAPGLPLYPSPPAAPHTNPVGPIPLANLSSLPFVEEELKRQKLRKLGWMMVGGGLLFAIFLDTLGDAIAHIINPLGRAISALDGIGALICLAGIFLVIYTRFILKPAQMPPVIVVQSPQMTGNLNPNQVSQAGPGPVMAQPGQLPPPSVDSYFYQSPSVTEHTTQQLKVPYPSSPRDTQ